MAINIDKLEKNIQTLVKNKPNDTFIFDLLLAYGIPKTSVTRLKKGDYNLSKNSGEVLWKKKVFFKFDQTTDLHVLIDQKKNASAISKHTPRFYIVTDYKTILALDNKTSDTLDIPYRDLGKYYDFFLPWVGMEKSQLQAENPADIKAAEKMGRLYDLILEDNQTDDEEKKHALNVFLSRLLFCFFAEDTNIFANGQFTNSLASHTAEDGSDLHKYLHKLFQVLNIESRKGLPKYLEEFPYVNGGLFQKSYPIPMFSSKSRKIIIECGSLNWAAINPDIFGSMIQAVVHTSQRGNLGMHYTSVANIMKVIQPLFLNDLYLEFEKAGDSKKRLEKLLGRLYNLQIFDPACGSGNFLIIAYKELCKLEIQIFKKLQNGQRSFRFMENIKLSQFYGIEIDDFAHETAKLSLWLAEHQMNLAFEQVFTQVRPTLPLQEGGNIVCGNATRLDWEEICPKEGEVYILGNPPYLGGKFQSKDQKRDMALAFKKSKKIGELDYICCWFVKSARYVAKTSAEFSFVTTSSICQGSQVHQLWPLIFELGLEIKFAHKPFRWSNNAKANAAITCSIIGISKKNEKEKTLYNDNTSIQVPKISAYLNAVTTCIVYPNLKPLSNLPKIVTGNSPYDGGNLLLSSEEMKEIVSKNPESSNYMKKICGSRDFLNGIERWCLWIDDDQLALASKTPEILERIEKTRSFREKGGEVARSISHKSHKFRYTHTATSSLIIVPRVSSIRRPYIPFGYLGKESIVSDSAQAIYDPDPYILSVVSSQMHMVWVRTLAGRLKTDYRYSSALCYNTFPFPNISDYQKEQLEGCVFKVLDEREAHSEKTMAQLYDPDKMPQGLRQAHNEMDLAVEQCYRKKPFKNDDERLEYLFKLYEEMIEAEKKQKKDN